MKFLKTLSFTLSFVFLFPWCLQAAEFPQIAEIKGKAWGTFNGAVRSPLKKQNLLKGRVILETDAEAEVLVRWDAERWLVLLPQTSLLIPSAGSKDSLIHLQKGEIRWNALHAKGSSVVVLSPVSEFIIPAADFLVSFDPSTALSEIKMVAGKMSFYYLNADEGVDLAAGEKTGFQGVVEDGKVVYDILLKGKKMPRGQYLKKTPLNSIETVAFADLAIKQLWDRNQKKPKVKITPLLPGQICREPNARFNECSWVCEGNPKKEKKECLVQQASVQCVRRRCNANGIWAEEKKLESSEGGVLCKAQPRVAACDY